MCASGKSCDRFEAGDLNSHDDLKSRWMSLCDREENERLSIRTIKTA